MPWLESGWAEAAQPLGPEVSPGLFAGGSLLLPCSFCSARTLTADVISVSALGVPSCILEEGEGGGSRGQYWPYSQLWVQSRDPGWPRQGWNQQHPCGVGMRPGGAVPLMGMDLQAWVSFWWSRSWHTAPAPSSRTPGVPPAALWSRCTWGFLFPLSPAGPGLGSACTGSVPGTRCPQVTATLPCLAAARCPTRCCQAWWAEPLCQRYGAACTERSQARLLPSTTTPLGPSGPQCIHIQAWGTAWGSWERGMGGDRAPHSLWGRQHM